MKKALSLLALAAALATSLSAQAAGPNGTAAEAQAMLEKAAAAIKTDKAKALNQFATGQAGFKDRDLYPFCGGPDGKFTAHPTLTGQSMKDLKGKDGDLIGDKIYAAAKEGAVTPVSYMWPKPGAVDPVKKVSLVTKIGDQVCAVGYYE